VRLRTITGTRFPSKCACGCGQKIPCDPDLKVVVDFDTSRPRLSYLPEHSPDYETYKPREWRSAEGVRPLPGLQDPAPAALEPPSLPPRPPAGPKPALDAPHGDEDTSPTPESGRAWSSGQLVFNAGAFESARAGFAAYALEGESSEQLRARVNRVILEDLETKVLGLRALHERLGIPGTGPSRTPSASPASAGASPAPAVALISPRLEPRGRDTADPRSTPTQGDLSVAQLVSRIEFVVQGDLFYPRRLEKEEAVRRALEGRGLQSLRACENADRGALEALLATLEAIDADVGRASARVAVG
jgi:hypothetical protein